MMNEKRGRILGLSLFILALAALLLYRPVLRKIGVDLDRTVPEWADFLTPGQYGEFLQEVRGYFQAGGLAVRIDDSQVYPEDGEVYSLKYVAQLCHQAKRGEWTAIIRGYFDRLIGRTDRPPSGQGKGLRTRPVPKQTP